MIKVEFSMPDLTAKLERHKAEIMNTIAAIAQTNRGMLFDSEGRHNGRSGWKPLRLRVGMILSDRGVLRKSMAPQNDGERPGRGQDGIVEFSGDEVTIGTRLFYAMLMNDGTTKLPGGVLRPTKAKALKIPLPQGKAATQGAKDLQAGNAQKSMDRLQKQYIAAKEGKAKAEIMKKINKAKHKGSKGGEQFIFRKSVKIPARPYNDWNVEDQAEMSQALARKVTSILNR